MFRNVVGPWSRAVLMDPWMRPCKLEIPTVISTEVSGVVKLPEKDERDDTNQGNTLQEDTKIVLNENSKIFPTCHTPFLVMHASRFQWEANLLDELKFVNSLPNVLHLRLEDTGHHNYTDICLMGPPIMALVGGVGWQDPVKLMDHINNLISLFIMEVNENFDHRNEEKCCGQPHNHNHDQTSGNDSSDICMNDDASSNQLSSYFDFNNCIQVTHKVPCFQILNDKKKLD